MIESSWNHPSSAGGDQVFRDGRGRPAKLAASIGLALGWTSWQALISGTFAGFALATVYGARIATHDATQTTQLPLGPFMLLGALVAFEL